MSMCAFVGSQSERVTHTVGLIRLVRHSEAVPIRMQPPIGNGPPSHRYNQSFNEGVSSIGCDELSDSKRLLVRVFSWIGMISQLHLTCLMLLLRGRVVLSTSILEIE